MPDDKRLVRHRFSCKTNLWGATLPSRAIVEAGDVETQEDFEDALLPAALLRGVIDEWESDVKAELGYETMPPTCRDGKEYDPLTPEGRERWLAGLGTQLGLTREQRSKMDLAEIFRRIRDA
jgi:hypothetical protein